MTEPQPAPQPEPERIPFSCEKRIGLGGSFMCPPYLACFHACLADPVRASLSAAAEASAKLKWQRYTELREEYRKAVLEGLTPPDVSPFTFNDRYGYRLPRQKRVGRYQKQPSPRAQRQRYGCHPSCRPAKEATRLSHLPWRMMITLTVSPGRSLREDLKILYRWIDDVDEAIVSAGGVFFFLYRVAQHPHYEHRELAEDRGRQHVHLLVGGYSLRDIHIRRLLDRWPSRVTWRLVGGKRRSHRNDRYGALHYVMEQAKDRKIHWQDGQAGMDVGRYVRAVVRHPMLAEYFRLDDEARRVKQRAGGAKGGRRAGQQSRAACIRWRHPQPCARCAP